MWFVNDARMGGKDSVNISKVLINICFDSRSNDRARNIRTPARESADLSILSYTKETRNN